MSCNINNWNTKKLENLQIPVKAFYKHKRTDWHPRLRVISEGNMEVELECGCEQLIKGILKDEAIHVTEINMYGEGSGTFKSWILDEALKESTGELEAVLIWETGEIYRLKVKEGVIEETEIEL